MIVLSLGGCCDRRRERGGGERVGWRGGGGGRGLNVRKVRDSPESNVNTICKGLYIKIYL